jgi:pantoate--beta-alanine ligase
LKLVDSIARMSTLSRMFRKEGKAIGFVPTMGYLHDGHLSLVRAARKHTDVVVMSVFVNPLQFGPKEDFERYPRDLKRDENLASSAGVDIIFCPSAKEMYPEGYSTYVNVEGLSETMCGSSRPGHFRGVATAVAKLFGIVRPDIAYFGQKDAQQAAIIRRMVRDLNMGIEIKVMPIVREKDGLAMSSRNTYLSESERSDAAVIHRSLAKAEELIASGERDAKRVVALIRAVLSEHPSVRTEYISIVGADDLDELDAISKDAIVAVAASVGRTRLIDNIVIRKGGKDVRSGQGRSQV